MPALRARHRMMEQANDAVSRSVGPMSARPAIGPVRNLVVNVRPWARGRRNHSWKKTMVDCDPLDSTRQPPPILWTLGLLHGELRRLHGLALHDYLVLGALAEAGGRPVPVARLTAFLQESGHRMSALLKSLQAAGLIERDRRDGDRRTVEVTLTDAGRARFTDAEKTARAVLGRRLVRGRVATRRSPAPG